ncbi:hypothetical protein [Bacterioplanes sanyensis]|nr:hypothetical protein [Bacterioplanes sanyensis]
MKYLLMAVVIFLAACGDNEFSKMSDKELRQRDYQCKMMANPSTAEIQVCNNIRRECERRAADGHYAC